MKIHTLTILLIIGITSCNRPKGSITPSIAICFDDSNIDSWMKYHHIFLKYDTKVTFCVSHIEKLDSSKIADLLHLQSLGHEIANHSLLHEYPKEYIEQYGISNYLKTEVDSAHRLFTKHGFNINSYVFPFGEYSPELIDSLKTRYKFSRGAIYNKIDKITRNKKTLDKYDNVFVYSKSQIFSEAMGIDNNYGNTIKLIEPAINRCLEDSLCMILYAHTISYMDEKYHISPLFLDSLLNISYKKGLAFKTLSHIE